jgi:hypothetical protein
MVNKSMPRDRSAIPWTVIIRPIVSIALAYPVSGFIYGMVLLIEAAITTPGEFLQHPIVDVFFVVLWTCLVPAFGGLVPEALLADASGAGTRVNMYPWIIPTALTLYFFLSKGWRWFRRAEK